MTRKVLFFAEAVSLAHVVRPAVLADRLKGQDVAVHFACASRYPVVRRFDGWTLHSLDSVSPDRFMQRLAQGQPVHNAGDLAAAVEEDLVLIDRVQPDLLIGDFRLSLSVSARLAAVPYMSVCNAHWSPWRAPVAAMMPAHPVGAVLGYKLPDLIFQALWGRISARHLIAPNALRQRHGLAPLQSLEHWYCDGDYQAYVDTPRLTPPGEAVAMSGHYVGPVVWSPPMEHPDWWPDVLSMRHRIAYLSMGTTGHVGLVPMLLESCLAAGVRCLVSTAGRTGLLNKPPDVYCEDYLPGLDACAVSALVVCNGGSATVHQALSQGRPVLGICSNLDQVRTMQYVEASGAGLFLRSNEASPARVAPLLRRLLDEPGFTAAAQLHAADFASFWRDRVFERLADQALSVHTAVEDAAPDSNLCGADARLPSAP